MRIPAIQIRQQHAKIGIDADLGRQSIRQPRAHVEIRQIPGRFDIRSPWGELRIDQSKAWDALGLGGTLEAFARIRSEARRVALEGIARIAEEGDRLAAIHLDTNAIADNAQEEPYRFHEFDYYGPASYDNVDVYYTARKPIIRFYQGGAEIRVEPRPPEISYERGKLLIYLRQRNFVEIIPPPLKLDLKV